MKNIIVTTTIYNINNFLPDNSKEAFEKYLDFLQ